MQSISFDLRNELRATESRSVWLRAMPLSAPHNYAFTELRWSGSQKISGILEFPKPITDIEETLQFILLVDAGLRGVARDYKAAQFVRMRDLRAGYSFSMFDVPSNQEIAQVQITAIGGVPSTAPLSLVQRDAFDVAKMRAACESYFQSFMHNLSTLEWTREEVRKTHLAVWPVAAPSAHEKTLQTIPLPAVLLAHVRSGDALNVGFLRSVCGCLGKLRGLQSDAELNVVIGSPKRMENLLTILEILGDLCTALQLNVEYIADEDATQTPREKIKFPEMDNLRGEDCEGVGASSYRVLHFLQTHCDAAEERRRKSLLFAQVLEMARRYDAVILTGSASDARFSSMDSRELMSRGALICHVFCIAFPKRGESGLLPALLLEGTNQAERIVDEESSSTQRAEERKVLMMLQRDAKIGEMMKHYEAHYPQGKFGFYRMVIEWWDESGGYLIRDPGKRFGVNFMDLLRARATTRDSVFELVPLPEIPQEIVATATQFVFKLFPQGYRWDASAVKLTHVSGSLKIARLGSRSNAFCVRFHNLSDVEAQEVFAEFLRAVQKISRNISMEKLTYDSATTRSEKGGERHTSAEKEREFSKHMHQISLRLEVGAL